MYSIEIPVTHGKYLREVFESIRQQTFQDYEVIVVNSGSDEISDVIKEYGFKEIKERVKLLKARYLAHVNSRGDRAILLDETRVLRRDALEIIDKDRSDMIIIGEREVGDSFWIKLAQLDKDNIMYCNEPDSIKGFALPRVISSPLLSKTFGILRRDLGEKFDQVIFPDHELIYHVASSLSNSVNVVREELISHYGDRTLLEIVKKYYKYGKSTKVLKGTKYEYFLNVSRKKRKICKGNKLLLYILYMARGVPFLIGEKAF
ncbi:glycosyl transferase family 2 [Sulfolobus sp. A20]|uniref:glycosyltransferase family A protein n=1 Tax=Saccharolobus sp. A20 TaxID=1891280 RepID=UPI000845ECC1|nr:glycosyltransferase family 2 protein [Sulfolobus sp. A20]TRM75057.1 glycosyltransferase family 2 protein [Sulfolobus sp. A20-N-F8]TRM76010.1 glycosyltransferase family 2 protein [Sulfolobus sp. B5]TRM79784.1 glycosyltransferase family 2 protein [Sulfolobus sp. D5]TRM83546.1 glycosyltransferase family 2 protein [Sulfolobus sp. A20-N-F6]TRN02215.1 glycosyltransferase family 2 protein [Sulfolobus sp. F1]TRN03893.1 glycosyltransferase family 2 protein [Sulfolobus sp. E1]